VQVIRARYSVRILLKNAKKKKKYVLKSQKMEKKKKKSVQKSQKCEEDFKKRKNIKIPSTS